MNPKAVNTILIVVSLLFMWGLHFVTFLSIKRIDKKEKDEK